VSGDGAGRFIAVRGARATTTAAVRMGNKRAIDLGKVNRF